MFNLSRVKILLAPVDQKVDNVIHWINLCPVDNASLLLRRFVFPMAEASVKRVTGNEPQGTMGRVSPFRLPLLAHFHQKRDVWVRGRDNAIFVSLILIR